MSRLIKLAGETALYGLGTIVPRAAVSLLVILHSRVFLPHEYGVNVGLYAWVAFLNILYLFGMETTYFRFASRPGANEQHVFRSAQTIVVLVSFLLSAGIIAIITPAASYFSVPQHPEFIVWLVAVMFIDAVVAIPFARLRLQKRARLFVTAKLVNVVLVIGLNFYFLEFAYHPDINIGYIILANLLANSIYLLFFAGTLIQWRPLWDRTMMREMFRYATPIMLMGLAGMTNEMYSRLTLGWWLPEGFYPGKDAAYALGVFGACFRFAVIVNVGVQAFRFAAEPFFFSNAADKNSPELFARVNHYFIIVSSFIVLSMVVHLDWLKYIVEEAYWEGLVIVPYLLYAYLFLGVYYNLSIWYKLTDRTYFGTIITVMGMVITLALNYVLIPIAGYLGSTWATLACYFSMAVVSYFLGQKYYPVPYAVGQALLYLVLSIVLINLSYVITFDQPWLAFTYHTGLMLVFAGFAYFRERRNLAT